MDWAARDRELLGVFSHRAVRDNGEKRVFEAMRKDESHRAIIERANKSIYGHVKYRAERYADGFIGHDGLFYSRDEAEAELLKIATQGLSH